MSRLKIRLTWIALMLGVVLVLAGCGGGETDVSGETTDGEPTESAAAPTEAPTEEPPTEMPASTETAMPPTATAEPTATEAPPTPTTAPTETAEPEQSNMVEPVEGACGNSFFPVQEGRTWHYQLTSPDSTIEYTISFRDVTDSSFIAVQTFPDFMAESEWTCTENGLVAGDFFQFAFPALPVDADTSFETVEIEGLTVPNVDQWQVGNSWDNSSVIRGEISMQGITTVAEITISQQNEIAAQESITVGAGTFDNAYRVESSGATSIDASIQGSSMSLGEFEVNSTSWYVEGVGLVRNTSTDQFGTETIMELVELE